MKAIIDEKDLRKFVRNQIKKSLKQDYSLITESGPISAVQGTAATYKPLEFGKCEIEVPQELKNLIEKIRLGYTERVKIDLYKKA